MDNNFQLRPEMLQHATDVECKFCNGIYFKQVVVIKKISKLVAASTKDVIISIPTFLCENCDTPLESEKHE